jgi:hypothetical protein
MTFTLELLRNRFAICRIGAASPIPDWARGELVSITRTSGEVSIVCPEKHVPDGIQAETGFRCMRVAGKLEFSLVGVIAALTGTLADAGMSVFVISTFDTDYLLVREGDLAMAIDVLKTAGHRIAAE